MTLAQIYAEQKKNLKIIEKRLEYSLEAPHPILNQASLDLLRAGGKRIRPLLVLLAAQYGDPERKEVMDSAVTLELIHMASLVHDDVVDDSDLRRGKPTVKAKWDNRVAMYTGDYIFARAIELISKFDHPKAHQVISKVIRDLSLGEIDQIRYLFNWKQNLRCYLLRIKRKTAILMALSCQLGGFASGCSDFVSKKLYYFGYFLGMSYQITDDVLDFVGTEKQLGKPAGSDLRNGNITLPAFYALQDRRLHDSVVSVLESNHPTEREWQSVVESIRNSDAIQMAENLSDLYLKKAIAKLHELPELRVTHSLQEIAEYVGTRKY
ncbi:heptaprenyl diphosphate synthase component II [Sporolactobacillus shoreae]|uniref:Heptaprenyl diphosphate synthase component II n=1 Tax=Sporolactobacillus shoreae TaxID=1465501 RepID=A0A4Z0GQD3_9BACL|nr:heptaprenyl diphosphate synthase component II [Sporolactobacillus shoreae]TGA98207.1 heptaprenyl diphosphate synthase component II [Sporolactobacillus shoreae]